MQKNNYKAILIGLLGIIAIFSCSWLGWRFMRAHYSRYTIGLVYVPSRAFHEQLNNKLIEIIKSDRRFAIKEFTAASAADLLLVNTVCNSAIESDADLIICTGISCAQGMTQAGKKRASDKPIIFMGVNDPVGLGLVSAMDAPGDNVTGVFSPPSQEKADLATLLLALKPTSRKILLPYAIIADGNEPQAYSLRKKLKNAGVKVTLLPIDNVNETLIKVASLLPGNDTLLYLEADALANYGAGLGKLASQHGVTMFASSIDGVKDAVFSYASDPISQAHIAFAMAKEILCSGRTPKNMPVQAAPNDRILTINKSLFIQQGLQENDIQDIVNSVHNNDELSLIHNRIKVM